MITDVQYMQIVNEVYDLSDYKTKRKILFCNEAQKVENIEGIVNRLYKHIKHDVTGIDFKTISASKGVISKVQNYEELNDCINSIHDLVTSYGESTSQIDSYSTAISNIQSRERLFTKAFTMNIEMPIMLYNVTVTSIISAISLLISSSIEFIKEGHDSFKTAFDKIGYKKSKDHILYQYICQFNKVCANGDIDKMINACIKNNLKTTNESGQIVDYETMQPIDEGKFTDSIKNIVFDNDGAIRNIGGMVATVGATIMASGPGQIILGAVAAIQIVISMFWLMRKAIFYLLHARVSLAGWFEAQATFLQINAENLKYRDDDKGDDHKKKVYQKQMKWVERFKKLSNFFALNDSKAKKEAKDDEEKEYKKRTEDEDEDNDGGLF